jgi:hypothetical protein
MYNYIRFFAGLALGLMFAAMFSSCGPAEAAYEDFGTEARNTFEVVDKLYKSLGYVNYCGPLAISIMTDEDPKAVVELADVWGGYDNENGMTMPMIDSVFDYYGYQLYYYPDIEHTDDMPALEMELFEELGDLRAIVWMKLTIHPYDSNEEDIGGYHVAAYNGSVIDDFSRTIFDGERTPKGIVNLEVLYVLVMFDEEPRNDQVARGAYRDLPYIIANWDASVIETVEHVPAQ